MTNVRSDARVHLSPDTAIHRAVAIAAGLLGGGAISALLFVTRLAGWRAELEVAIGTLVVRSEDQAWFLGLAVHLFVSGAVGLLYAKLFHHAYAASAQVGALVGLMHAWIVAAATLAFAALAPGPLLDTAASGFGIDPRHLDGVGMAAFWASHVLYGLVVGAVYARAR